MTRPAMPAEAFDHGDPRRYRRGCRCRPCIDGVTAAVRQGRFLRETGRGKTTTTHRAARHIDRLRAAGMPDREIMADALISQSVLYRIIRHDGVIRRATETRILAVRPRGTELPGSGGRIPGIGTTRRLRALAADGWPAAELGRRCGKYKQFIVYLQNQPNTLTVRRWVAGYVAELYSQLEGLQPEQHGVPPHIAQRTRERAAAKGWVGRAYWDDDDFDNPDFQPATGATPRYISLAENGLELEAQGHTRKHAAERLQVTPDHLTASIARYHKTLGAAA
ncbi:hypothetical protein ACFZAO_05670 [Streptomyces griseoaurantiacus]|uniref:hypothetical protein n=1 Tax=Streptomyces griseoaurantiacus TaxID=68213 RepID=UPI0036EA524C